MSFHGHSPSDLIQNRIEHYRGQLLRSVMSTVRAMYEVGDVASERRGGCHDHASTAPVLDTVRGVSGQGCTAAVVLAILLLSFILTMLMLSYSLHYVALVLSDIVTSLLST
jgi:hypothetical protein